MHIKDLNGKKICILGFGKEGQAAYRALQKYVKDYALTIADDYPTIQEGSFNVITGIRNALPVLHDFDVIIKSPGIPPHPELLKLRDKITSCTQIFFDSVAPTGASIIGVTGSKGKSTTSSLIYEVLKKAGKDAYLLGNIGKPSLDYIELATNKTIFVLEMSSYQLMDLAVSPSIAVVTSFFPEHLDYHGSLEAYHEAKKHIARFQLPDGIVFYNELFPEAKEIADESVGTKIPFSADNAPLRIEETKLLGKHNLSNMAAAFKVARHLGVPEDVCLDVFRSFRGLPHRLQSLGTHHGIEWVDDAISTTPESTIAALDALGDRISTIILGGQDRGNDFTELGRRIAASQIRNVILFPGSGGRIFDATKAAGADVKYFNASSMEQAVAHAKQHTELGYICLLSTASPSYGMFKNFEEKGDLFRDCIIQN